MFFFPFCLKSVTSYLSETRSTIKVVKTNVVNERRYTFGSKGQYGTLEKLLNSKAKVSDISLILAPFFVIKTGKIEYSPTLFESFFRQKTRMTCFSDVQDYITSYDQFILDIVNTGKIHTLLDIVRIKNHSGSSTYPGIVSQILLFNRKNSIGATYEQITQFFNELSEQPQPAPIITDNKKTYNLNVYLGNLSVNKVIDFFLGRAKTVAIQAAFGYVLMLLAYKQWTGVEAFLNAIQVPHNVTVALHQSIETLLNSVSNVFNTVPTESTGTSVVGNDTTWAKYVNKTLVDIFAQLKTALSFVFHTVKAILVFIQETKALLTVVIGAIMVALMQTALFWKMVFIGMWKVFWAFCMSIHAGAFELLQAICTFDWAVIYRWVRNACQFLWAQALDVWRILLTSNWAAFFVRMYYQFITSVTKGALNMLDFIVFGPFWVIKIIISHTKWMASFFSILWNAFGSGQAKTWSQLFHQIGHEFWQKKPAIQPLFQSYDKFIQLQLKFDHQPSNEDSAAKNVEASSLNQASTSVPEVTGLPATNTQTIGEGNTRPPYDVNSEIKPDTETGNSQAQTGQPPVAQTIRVGSDGIPVVYEEQATERPAQQTVSQTEGLGPDRLNANNPVSELNAESKAAVHELGSQIKARVHHFMQEGLNELEALKKATAEAHLAITSLDEHQQAILRQMAASIPAEVVETVNTQAATTNNAAEASGSGASSGMTKQEVPCEAAPESTNSGLKDGNPMPQASADAEPSKAASKRIKRKTGRQKPAELALKTLAGESEVFPEENPEENAVALRRTPTGYTASFAPIQPPDSADFWGPQKDVWLNTHANPPQPSYSISVPTGQTPSVSGRAHSAPSFSGNEDISRFLSNAPIPKSSAPSARNSFLKILKK